MRKILPILLLCLAVLLSACAGQGQPAASTSQATQAEAYANGVTQESQGQPTAAASTPLPEATLPADALATQASGPAAPPGCRVTSPDPTPGPTEQSAFPAISDNDWVEGPSDASVSIIEYGDFM